MQGSLAGLQHEAASVYRLVDFIEHFCHEQSSTRSYVSATTKFLGLVIALAEDTKQYILRATSEAKRRAEAGTGRTQFFERWLINERGVLHTIKGSWTIIHKYLKPAAEAHALQVPVPLVKLAERQIRSVQGMSDAVVAVLLTPELNYFQTPHTRFQNAVNTLKQATNGPALPASGPVGFVELPFSQGPSFFNNVALYHELGHFALAECSSNTAVLKKAAEHSLRGVLGAQFTSLDKTRRAGFESVLQKWAEEIFCDLFAIRLIGPAFSFASIEVFSLLGLLSDKDKGRFQPSHPAPACRFRQQLKLLKEDGWWSAISAHPSNHRLQIEELAAFREDRYTLYVDGQTISNGSVLEAFRRVLNTVEELVKRVTTPPRDAVECLGAERNDIQGCLAKGVVPSRIFSGRPLSSALPVAVVNAAYCFYLSGGLSNLIDQLADKEASDPKDRSYWTKRLEMWTMKAVEDFFLLEGVQKYGRGATRGAAVEAPNGPG